MQPKQQQQRMGKRKAGIEDVLNEFNAKKRALEERVARARAKEDAALAAREAALKEGSRARFQDVSACLEAAREWVESVKEEHGERVAGLAAERKKLGKALSPAGWREDLAATKQRTAEMLRQLQGKILSANQGGQGAPKPNRSKSVSWRV
eukprot:scaffold11.g3899.t1